MAAHRIGARLAGLSPEQLCAFIDEQAPLWSAAALRVAEEHAALVEQPEWVLSEVLLSPDLAPHILAQLPTKAHAVKGTCRAWRRGWKETLKKRDRPRLVVFGGHGSNDEPVSFISSLERYDPSTNEWEGETVAPMLTARDCCGMAVLDGKLYAAGGRDEGDESCNLVERYDLATKGWEVVAPMAVARNQPGVAVLDGKLYAVGGMETGDGGVPNRLSSVERYCPATNAWEMVAPMGSVRQSPAMAVLDGKLYAVGGYGIEEEEEEEEWGNDGRPLNSVERYDPEMNAWEAVAPMGSSRDECGVAVLEDQLYAVGGEGSEPDSDDGDGALRSVIRYDLATNTWETVAPMSTERKALGVTVLDGMLYAVGGENYEGVADDDYEGPFMKSAERFNPATSAWEEVAPMAAARAFASALSM